MTVDCSEHYDFVISSYEELDYLVSFADWLDNEGGISITTQTITSSPELSVSFWKTTNGGKDYVLKVIPLVESGCGWVKVLADTNKLQPDGEFTRKDATIVFNINLHRVQAA